MTVVLWTLSKCPKLALFFMLLTGQCVRQTFTFLTCLFICYQTCEHRILKTNEPILITVGVSSPQGKGMKQSTVEIKGEGHKFQCYIR